MSQVAQFRPIQNARNIMRSRVESSLYRPETFPARTDFERSFCPTCKAPRLERTHSAPSFAVAGEPSLSARVRAWWRDTEEVRAVLLFLALLAALGLCLWAWLQVVVFAA